MQKFGDDGNEFWWNDEDQDTLIIIIGVMVILGGILFFRYIKATLFDFICVACLMIFFGIGIGRAIYLHRRKIPNLYMNEQGLNINGDFVSWNWIIKVEIREVPASKPQMSIFEDRIFIVYHKPGKRRKSTACLMPKQSEVGEIKEYIEVFWRYYKTNISEVDV